MEKGDCTYLEEGSLKTMVDWALAEGMTPKRSEERGRREREREREVGEGRLYLPRGRISENHGGLGFSRR